MNKNRKRLVMAAAAICLLSSGTSIADERGYSRHAQEAHMTRHESSHHRQTLPAYYPARFKHQGVVRSLVQDGKLMISGKRYAISPNVIVHTPHTRHASVFSLQAGDEIGFLVDSTGKTITTIWILPRNSIRQD